ncbi:MAG TPA: PAS domain-containing sensor histidine kinase [Acidimicrobiales bacterium]
MATFPDLARQHTDLERPDVVHLLRLQADWGLLADFCFADVLLYAPARDGRWLVMGHVRPVTGQTLYLSDWVGSMANESERIPLQKAFGTGEMVEGEITVEGLPDVTRLLAIPVRRQGRVIAVMTKEWSPRTGRQPGELERTYQAIFHRFAAMIAEGSFPFETRRSSAPVAPRVGDGVMVVDADARVQYASPNAVSALHRVGITANAVGQRLAELGFNDASVRQAFERHEPVIEEVDQTDAVTLLTRCIPITAGGSITGGVLLLRDVSELRQRDRLLLSKDATIREIHHRVKNNLQTISSLLRLQARRTASDEAKDALAEAVRRIRTIAIVHETLSREASDDVAFVEIVRPLLRLAEDSLQSPERPVRFRVEGDGGKLPAGMATPLAVVLTELLQNAVAHAFRNRNRPGNVVVLLEHDDHQLTVKVIDDGIGVPDDFSIDRTSSLGLTIVRTLVTTELAGEITVRAGTPVDHQRASLQPPDQGTGTTVLVDVPMRLEV